MSDNTTTKVVTYESPTLYETVDVSPEQEAEMRRNHVWPRDSAGTQMVNVRMGLRDGEPADLDTTTGKRR